MAQEKPEAAEQTVPEQTTTPEVDIASLQAKLTKLETELEQTKKGLSTAHQTLTQKDRELKAQQDFSGKLSSIEQRLEEQRQISELQAAAIALGREGSEEELAKVNQLLRSKVAEQEAARKLADVKRQQEQQALATQEYNQKADAIYAQAQTLFEGDDLKDIEDLLKSGNLTIAQREVRLASKGKTPAPKVEPKETEDARVARQVREQLVRDYPDLYKSDTGSPSGGKLSAIEAVAKFNKGEMTAEEAKKHGFEFL